MSSSAAAALPSSLAGRHAIVTGGSRGIGAAIAAALAADGADVTVMGRDAATLEARRTALREAGATGKLGIAVADLSDAPRLAAAFRAATDALGPAAILINNAGVAPSAPFAKQTLEGWNAVLALDLTASFL